jgi:uncharacterized protein YjbI with pentapeptide repeats
MRDESDPRDLLELARTAGNEPAGKANSDFRRDAPSRLVLCGVDLRALNFTLINLEGADLRACDLRGCDLSDKKLRYIDLRGAAVQGANFENSSLYGAKLQGIEADHANFRGCDLRLANIGGAYTETAILPAMPQLESAELDAVRAGSAAHDMRLVEAFLKRANPPAGLLEAPGVGRAERSANGDAEPRLDVASRINWRGADLRGVNLTFVNLEGADLRGCNLRGCELSDKSFRFADLRGAEVQGGNFQNSSFYGAKMQGIEAHRANFRGCDLREANLGGAYLERAVLPGRDDHHRSNERDSEPARER